MSRVTAREAADMKTALAVDVICGRLFALMPLPMLITLKFAMMLHMGVEDPFVMMAAVEECGRHNPLQLLELARVMQEDGKQLPMFEAVKRGVGKLLVLHRGRLN